MCVAWLDLVVKVCNQKNIAIFFNVRWYCKISQAVYNLNKMIYTVYTVLMANTERKLQILLDNALKEKRKKVLIIYCKVTECIFVSKREIPRCKLQNGNVKIMQMHKYNIWLVSWKKKT